MADRLAEVIAEFEVDEFNDAANRKEKPSYADRLADAIRAAVAAGELDPETLGLTSVLANISDGEVRHFARVFYVPAPSLVEQSERPDGVERLMASVSPSTSPESKAAIETVLRRTHGDMAAEQSEPQP